ncbi:MAG: ATP-binding cassette domain-containing protein [Pseudomonadales bacterium]
MFELKGVNVLRKGEALFPEVNLTLDAGQLEVVMGPSGCGKSSLLAAIAGTLGRDFSVSGEILLERRSICTLPIELRQVGLQFQDDLLFPHLDVTGNLLFALAQGDRQKRLQQVQHALVCAGLEGFDKRDVATLSGGQRARISLLRTLLAKPKLLLLDEPYSRLDQALRASFRQFVIDQLDQYQTPALLVTHDIQDCPNERYYDLQRGEFVLC